MRDAITEVERALSGGQEADALDRTRSLLLEAAADPRALTCAAKALEAVGETELAEAFAAAAASESTDAVPLVWLSQGLLQLDDPEVALAIARAASARDGGDAASAAAVAHALAALGRHDEVVAELDRFAPDWTEAALLRRYVASAALCGDWARWEASVAALDDDPDSTWVRRLGERARRFPAEDGPTDQRHELFVRYGSALIDTTPEVTEAEVPRLGAWIVSAASLLQPLKSDDLRVAYVGPRSEVIARWLARVLDVGAIPLSARLPEVVIIVALADDGDLDALYETEAFFRAPSVLVQAVKDPTHRGTPVPEVIGLLGAEVELPLSELEADKAADRMPPTLLASKLEADAGSAKATPPIVAWAEARRGHLTLEHPPLPGERALF